MATRKREIKKESVGFPEVIGMDDFVLRGKDFSSPMVILLWMAINVNTISDEKLKSAFDMVLRTRKVLGRRAPD